MSLQLIAEIVETFRVTGNHSGGRHLSPMLAVLQLQAHLRGSARKGALCVTWTASSRVMTSPSWLPPAR